MSEDTEAKPAPSYESPTAETAVKRTRKAKPAPSDDLFPIMLKKHYRPFGIDPKGWGDFLIERDGDLVTPGVNDDGYADRDKIAAGTVIHVPIEEARRAIKQGIAERADEL